MIGRDINFRWRHILTGNISVLGWRHQKGNTRKNGRRHIFTRGDWLRDVAHGYVLVIDLHTDTFWYCVNFQICVGFPQQVEYHRLEKLVMVDKLKRFMARPPPPKVEYENLSPVQRWAVDLMSPISPTTSTARPSRRTRRTKMSADGVEKPQVLYVCGRAGSGKTEVALHLCQLWKVLHTNYFLVELKINSGCGSGL